jgi:hypothetical protein
MTISTTSTTVTYQGNGSTTAFTFSFVADSPSDLVVSLTDSSGIVTLLDPSQYSVVLNPVPTGGLWGIGGTVTYPISGSPISSGTNITITRAVPYTQDVSISNQGAFYPQAVEQALDVLELQIQQIKTESEYSLKFPLSGGVVPDDLLGAAERAGNVLAFDDNGQVVMKPNNDVTITVNTVTQVKDSFSEPALAYSNSPPGSPADKDRYLIGNTPTGAWSGKQGLLAEYDASIPGWTFSPTPKQGQMIFNSGANMWYIYRNTWWNKVLSNVEGAMYQDFADIPDGTNTSSIILASGHGLAPTGPGATGAIVSGGKIVAGPGGNTYNVVNYPYKNIRMGMKYSFQVGHTGSSYEATLAAGTYVSGAIISKMVHCEYLYQNFGDVSIWGGPRQTIVGGVPLGYLAPQDLQHHYRAADDNYPDYVAGDIVYAEVYINGNNIECHGASGLFTDSYTDAMISGSLGDDASGNLGYLYFQQGTATDSFVPYIYMIFAEPVAPTQDLPNPAFLGQGAAAPIVIQKTQTYGGGTQPVCSFTAQDDSLYLFEVWTNIAAVGTTPGYAQLTAKYICQVGFFAGAFNSTITTAMSKTLMSENSSVINLDNTFTISNSGFTVTLNANPTRTGTDTTSTEQTTYIINNIIEFASFA